ncbi:DoxX family protein [Tsukamurella pulmonis]|uniref:DoxX family protein n=1 Tax=Tsukamurella pulmonis TaxID=47312 RepID=UPI00079513C5|nr:DoxX family protein [Tsukamurella pulmonis]KXP09102.1 DoxX family protein [Tsukamurella pulmonis]RDH11450.1 DoxX family protein [Tsukamurella pulmonis]
MNRWAPYYLSALRIVTGVLFALHGAATFWGFLDGRRSSPEVFAWPSWWGAVIQLVGGLLIAIGALTRPAAIIASGSMAYAYFAFHAGDGLSPLANHGELSVLYCWVLLLFAFTGPGPISVDALLGRRRAGDLDAPAADVRGAAEPAL